MFKCVCVYVVSECLKTRQLPSSTSLSPACWPGPGQLEPWLEGHLLLLALAGPAGNLKDALLHSGLGCYVAAVSELSRKRPGWPCGSAAAAERLCSLCCGKASL